MTDLIHVLLEMRNGAIAADLSAKFQEVLDAVIDHHGKGELTIHLRVEPAKLGSGGVVLEVEMVHETKLKKPQPKFGRAVFFVGSDRRLTRTDPNQEAMFDMEKER